MATSRPTLLFPTLLLLCILSPEFPSKVAADGSPECPYPCLPPPTSVTNYPPPPSLPPPPPQPYTPGYNPMPTPPSNVPYYPAPGFVYPAPPPPNKIMPYFPYYYRTAPNSAPVKKSSLGLPMAVLHLFLLGVLLS